MQPSSIAKLFATGGSQAVRLPAEFRFEGSEVFIRRDARSGEVILTPKSRKSWAEFVALRERMRAELEAEGLDSFGTEREQPPAQVRDTFDGWQE